MRGPDSLQSYLWSGKQICVHPWESRWGVCVCVCVCVCVIDTHYRVCTESRNKLDGQRTRIDLQSMTLSEIKVRYRMRPATRDDVQKNTQNSNAHFARTHINQRCSLNTLE